MPIRPRHHGRDADADIGVVSRIHEEAAGQAERRLDEGGDHPSGWSISPPPRADWEQRRGIGGFSTVRMNASERLRRPVPGGWESGTGRCEHAEEYGSFLEGFRIMNCRPLGKRGVRIARVAGLSLARTFQCPARSRSVSSGCAVLAANGSPTPDQAEDCSPRSGRCC